MLTCGKSSSVAAARRANSIRFFAGPVSQLASIKAKTRMGVLVPGPSPARLLASAVCNVPANWFLFSIIGWRAVRTNDIAQSFLRPVGCRLRSPCHFSAKDKVYERDCGCRVEQQEG